jgi:hypothetical protein
MITIMESITSGQKTNITQVIVDATRKATESMINELNESGVLNKGNLQRVLAQGDQVAATVVKAVKEKIAELAENIVGYVKLISGAKKIILKPTDGKETIYKAKEVFRWIDGDFRSYGCDVKSKPTKEIPVQVYEMIKDGTFQQIFGGFGENLDRLVLTQPQIIQFVKDHSDMLRTDGYGTFFLFKVESEFFVALVRRGGGGWRVDARRLSGDYVWDAEYCPRLVVPQLSPVSD